jgi:hypothetical protein
VRAVSLGRTLQIREKEKTKTEANPVNAASRAFACSQSLLGTTTDTTRFVLVNASRARRNHNPAKGFDQNGTFFAIHAGRAE